MEKRVRSPNYPALSLPDAVEKVTLIYQKLHNHSAPREVIATAMGYAGLNGASATAVSALHKYGLLEGSGDEIKVSNRSLRILHPHSISERVDAIKDAANEPPLFTELLNRFPGKIAPNDELLKNYLIRKGFSPAALPAVISSFRDTIDMVYQASGGAGNPTMDILIEPSDILQNRQTIEPILKEKSSFPMGSERSLGRYDFEDGSYVQISVSGDINTEAALEMIETLIKLKLLEIHQRKKIISSPMAVGNSDVEDLV